MQSTIYTAHDMNKRTILANYPSSFHHFQRLISQKVLSIFNKLRYYQTRKNHFYSNYSHLKFHQFLRNNEEQEPVAQIRKTKFAYLKEYLSNMIQKSIKRKPFSHEKVL